MIRVIYRFRVHSERQGDFAKAWHAIVEAHVERGHGALSSMLLRDPEAPHRVLAISRWRSREHWVKNQNSEAAPDAYALMAATGTLLSREVYEEDGFLLAPG